MGDCVSDDAATILGAMATQIKQALSSDIPDIQVEPTMMWNPTPPAIDIYPADPFEADTAYGQVSELNFEVRARVDTPDREGAFALILGMMDPGSDTCVRAALFADKTLNGNADDLFCSSPSGLSYFTDPGGHALLGTTWLVTVV